MRTQQQPTQEQKTILADGSLVINRINGPGTRLEVDRYGVARYVGGQMFLPMIDRRGATSTKSPVRLSCWSVTSAPTQASTPVILDVSTAIAGGPAHPQETKTAIWHGTALPHAWKILHHGLVPGQRQLYGDGAYVTGNHNGKGKVAYDFAKMYATQAATQNRSTPAVLSGFSFGQVIHCTHPYDVNNQANAGSGPFACDMARPNIPVTQNNTAQAIYLRLAIGGRTDFNKLAIHPDGVVYADEAKRAAARKVATDINTHAAYANTLERAGAALLAGEELSQAQADATKHYRSHTSYIADPTAYGASIDELIYTAYKYRDTLMINEIAKHHLANLLNSITAPAAADECQDKLRFVLQSGVPIKKLLGP
ncbi:MAG: hypothetical protein ABGY11_11655, partial [Candidatus Thioglobus sp.]